MGKYGTADDPYITDPELMAGIKQDCNDEAWRRFEETYRKFIWSIARNYNVREADRDGVVNDIMAELYRTRDRFNYDSDKGRFRNYLRQVVQDLLADLERR